MATSIQQQQIQCRTKTTSNNNMQWKKPAGSCLRGALHVFLVLLLLVDVARSSTTMALRKGSSAANVHDYHDSRLFSSDENNANNTNRRVSSTDDGTPESKSMMAAFSPCTAVSYCVDSITLYSLLSKHLNSP